MQPAAATLYLAYATLAPLARQLPRARAYAAARRLMDTAWLGWAQGRRDSIRNAETILPRVDWQGDAASLARAQWRAYGEYLVDAVRLPQLTPAQCFDALDGPAEDWARLREAYGARPTLFAVMHMGNWDVLGGAYTHACGRSHVVVDPLGHPQLDRAIQAPRDRLGMTPQSGAVGVRRAIEALRGGGTAAVLFDRPPAGRDDGVYVKLFGRPVRLSSTLARVAVAADAQVIPLAAVRVQPGQFHFQALIDLDVESPPSPPGGDRLEAITQTALAAFEPWLAAHPGQWYQFGQFFAR